MSEVWSIIVFVILLLILYGIVSSKLEKRRNTKIRSQTIPMITDYPTTDALYNLRLSDGRKFLNTLILGSIEGDAATFPFAGYNGMLVVKLESGRKAFI